jgi:hypothetical protein
MTDFYVPPILTLEESLKKDLQQCRQLICALVTQYGTDSEHGKFLDVNDNSMLMTTSKTELLIGYLPIKNTTRLLIPIAKPSPEITTTLQTSADAHAA